MTYEDTTARDGTTSQATTIWAEELIEDEEMEKVSYFSLFPKLVYSSALLGLKGGSSPVNDIH